MTKDYTKEFYQRSWGEQGYYENFAYGVGINRVCEVCLTPFLSAEKEALEIGCGGGAFTSRMVNNFKHLTAIDVIKKPAQFNDFTNFTFIELPSFSFDCKGVEPNSMDFVFSYNVFCHLSNEAIKEYISNVSKVLKAGCDFVVMISNIDKINEPKRDEYKLGDLLPMGHFYQNDSTIDLVVNKKDWTIVSRNMIPEHRDIVIHLRKKKTRKNEII